MRFFKKHPLLSFFILGLLIRLGLLFLDFSFDVNNHISWAADLAKHGPYGFYTTISSAVFASLYPNYPPISIFFFYLANLLHEGIFQIIWWLNVHIPAFPSKLVLILQDRNVLAGFMKLPAVGFDLGIAWLAILFAKKIVPKSKQAPIIAAVFILLNPVFIYNSAYWGQIDAIPLFFTLASLYLLLYSESFLISALLFTVGILVKPTPIIFLPAYIVYFIYKFGLIKSLKSFGASFILFWIVFMPFLHQFWNLGELYSIFSVKILEAQSLPFVTNGAFNFWLIFTQFKGIKDTELLLGVPFRIWGYAITFIFMAYILFLFYKSKTKIWSFLFATFLSSFAAILFLTKMHERYFILVLPFILFLSLKEKRFMKWFYILTLFSFLNLYHSWSVPNIDILKFFVLSPITYTVICIANCVIFFFLLKEYKQSIKK